MEKLWWQKPMRALQYNLQVKDTPGMVPSEIAAHLESVHSNVVIVNAGGIYAWYDTEVPFHHKNEYLPEDFDLLSELIQECHKRDIRVIFRFDWSLAEDTTCLKHPEWFAVHPDGTPYYKGKDRMGNWSFLLTTCINSAYRNDAVAVPAMKEAVSKYDLDGIFFNNPGTPECHCARCKEKYRKLYGTELPENPADFHPDWHSQCLKDNIGKLQAAVRSVKDIPFVLYYSGMNTARKEVDNLDERFETAEMLCTEAQDVLSLGVDRIPPVWKPMVNMKLGNAVPGKPRPFGIIHSCPGMDWRHAGLPKDEYLFWMAQVPANNAFLWHSVTGYPDTITDKRLLSAVEEIDRRIALQENDMDGAVGKAEVLLLWDGSEAASGFAEGLSNMQYQFDLMDTFHLSLERMKQYETVILPGGFQMDEKRFNLLKTYVKEGGHLLLEKTDLQDFEGFKELIGCKEDYDESVPLTAAYLRFENEEEVLRKGMEEMLYVPLRDQVLYLRPEGTAETLLSLIPPFAPLDGVGAPPERASLAVSRTDIAPVIRNHYGKGTVITLAFRLSSLIPSYHLEDHYLLLRNLLDSLTPEKSFHVEKNVAGILATVYTSGKDFLVHLINGVGKRPRIGNLPVCNYEFTLNLPEGVSVKEAVPVIEGAPVRWTQEGNHLKVILSQLDVWEMIKIQTY